MRRKISVSEARTRLSRMLKELQQDPELVFEITVNDLVVGELRASESDRFQIKPGEALLTALEGMGEPEVPAPKGSPIAREHDRYLYTKEGV